MNITPALIKEVREKTGIGVQKCKDALTKTGGDVEKAIDELRRQGLQTAEKKSGRNVGEGSIFEYIHAGAKLGVMIELCCESDFVSRTEDFKALGKDLCMQIAAASPAYVGREDVPADVLAREKDIYRDQVAGKPPAVAEKILEGKLKKFYESACLLEQPFIKDEALAIQTLIKNCIAKLGENIKVRRFVRMEMGR